MKAAFCSASVGGFSHLILRRQALYPALPLKKLRDTAACSTPLITDVLMSTYIYFKNTKNLFIHIASIPIGDSPRDIPTF